MSFNTQSTRKRLQAFDFKPLFIEELGWDRYAGAVLLFEVGEHGFELERIAEKRGVGVFLCRDIPDNATRRKIEHQLTRQVREHLIIYTDPEQTVQKWQWVRRETGKPLACREHEFQKGQSGEALVQRLESLYVPFEEEEDTTTTAVTSRTRRAFDVERVTKAFYKRFQEEHKAFLGFIDGITAQGDKDWYASVMLNRLMFCYFIQKKGFLDGDLDYLRNRMQSLRGQHGGDKFYSFYRYFLLRLFHEGLGDDEHAAELEILIGKVPYLNGGLFAEHLIEQKHDGIVIEDAAFERIFDFFDQYHWHLDDRPLSSDKEINPDVLGYIFEKYINQKQMGAYYTKEDITEYISRSTIIPFLFDAAKKACPIAFRPESHMWRLLAEDPDRYIFDAVKYGAKHELPGNIAAGLDDVSKRGDWNTSAPREYALPTEIWREVVARRKRYEEVRGKLVQSEVSTINDFITLNLDIRQFAEDVISHCEGPELLRAFWKALNKITVLDPTCGSGAFLFAALNILEPLYETCLERMEGFLEDLDRSTEKHRPEKFSDFRKVLAEMAKHPNRRYFIYKSIILNNLYGVDLMEEATEIAKLRLFLKLASLTERDECKPNMGLEPLPDIDFNIRVGNTLVGFASLNDVKRVMEGDMIKLLALPDIQEKAEDVESAYWLFREMQIEYGMDADDFHETKQNLQDRLQKLNDELDSYLAEEYGISDQSLPDEEKYEDQFSRWKENCQPFHWFVDFYGIMNEGGFDVIIGNPPYVAASKVRRDYQVKHFASMACPDIYAWVLERCCGLLERNGCSGMIVPLSLSFSGDFDGIRRLLFDGYGGNWFSSYGRIPSALFSFDVRVRNVIHIGSKQGKGANHTTRLHRWFEGERSDLFCLLEYADFTSDAWHGRIPKINTSKLASALEACIRRTDRASLASSLVCKPTDHVLHFKKTAYNWLCFCREQPPCYDSDGNIIPQSQFDSIGFMNQVEKDISFLLLNGKLLYGYWIVVGDDFHVAKWMFADFPIALSRLPLDYIAQLLPLADELDTVMQQAVSFKNNAGKRVGNFNLAKCRHVTDKSDKIFAKALGLEEVLDDIERLYFQVVRTNFCKFSIS